MGVTPHVGVWIEIGHHGCGDFHSMVTPHVGVWIEILNSRTQSTPS